jgi:biotin-(acetyl-CoA carboxylase) ligase
VIEGTATGINGEGHLLLKKEGESVAEIITGDVTVI